MPRISRCLLLRRNRGGEGMGRRGGVGQRTQNPLFSTTGKLTAASGLPQGAIFQRVDLDRSRLDNIVELEPLKPGWFPLAGAAPILRAHLQHTFSVGPARAVTIVYDSTAVEALTASRAPATFLSRALVLRPPPLQRLLPQSVRSASFHITYLDDAIRITRGDRGELRVYRRDEHGFE